MRLKTLGGYPIEQHDSPNKGGAMTAHKGVVLHHAEGTYRGTISWQMNPDQRYGGGTSVNTCSTWIIGKNVGEWAQMVDTSLIAWCQRSGSRDWLSIEFAGYATEYLTDWQLQASALLLGWIHQEYGVPVVVAKDPSMQGLGHHSMDREWLGEEWGHEDCPGPRTIAQKLEIVARAIRELEMSSLTAQDEQAEIWRIEAIANDREIYGGGPEKGKPVPFWARMAEHESRLSQVETDLDEIKAALVRIEELLRAGQGSVTGTVTLTGTITGSGEIS